MKDWEIQGEIENSLRKHPFVFLVRGGEER